MTFIGSHIGGKLLPLMKSVYNTNAHVQVAGAPNTGTERLQYHLT